MVLEEKAMESLQQWGYESLGLIGKGNFGEVYLVRRKDRGRFVACKMSERKKILKQESRLLQIAKHALFPEYYDYQENEGWGMLFMEYISGITLEKYLNQYGRMSRQQGVQIGLELAEGLCYLQELNPPILFRDLKPENIILQENGRVRLLDFGSATRMDEAFGVKTGTYGYGAPEQWEVAGRVGCYSDVYALGKVLLTIMDYRSLYYGERVLLEECVREKIEERVPNMRCFLSRLQPYVSEDKRAISEAERETRRYHKKERNYLFQQSIIKF